MIDLLKNKTCCFTGHRKLPEKNIKKIEARLEKEIEELIKSGFCYFAVGGAQGFDTVAGQINPFPTVIYVRRRKINAVEATIGCLLSDL